MAQATIHIDAREACSTVADARSHAYRGLGSLHVRSADPTWPERDSTFDHTVG